MGWADVRRTAGARAGKVLGLIDPPGGGPGNHTMLLALLVLGAAVAVVTVMGWR